MRFVHLLGFFLLFSWHAALAEPSAPTNQLQELHQFAETAESSGRIGEAIWAHQRVLTLLPGNEQSQNKLVKLRNKLSTPGSSGARLWIPSGLSSFALVTIFITASCIWSGLTVLYVIRRTGSVFLRYATAVIAVYCGLAYVTNAPRGPGEDHFASFINFGTGLLVTTSDDTPVMALPNENSQIAAKLRQGSELRFQKTSGKYAQVNLSDGRFGWLNIDTVKVITPPLWSRAE